MKSPSTKYRGFLGVARKFLLIAVVVMLGTGLSVTGTVNAQSPLGSMLVTPVTIPGWGGYGPAPCGTNPAYLTPVLRFEFVGTGALNPLSSILPCPESLVNDPRDAAFNSQGELFVANRHGNVLSGVGSIARFTLDSSGNFVANGSITGNSLEAVHGLAFSPAGELFAVNFINGTISRFLFDAAGNAIPNGTISIASGGQDLTFSPNGELFVTHAANVVERFRFDPITQAAISNGSFVVPDSVALTGLTFSAQGELFIADPYPNLVFRVLFDGVGNPIGNGTISVAGAPIGVAFSSAGELFVTSHFDGGISRFLFDGSGNAIFNGFTPTANLGGVVILSRVSIDIKPGTFPNSINPRIKAKIPVAILTTYLFDASTIDPTTVRFGRTGTEAAPVKSALQDVDGDGDTDMILHFNTQDTGIQCGDTFAILAGKTFSGQAIEVADSIRTMGCK